MDSPAIQDTRLGESPAASAALAILLRPQALFFTLAAALFGGLMAWRVHFFDLSLWLWTATGLLLAHAAANLLQPLLAGAGARAVPPLTPGPLEQGRISRLWVWCFAAVLGTAALGCGAWLVALRGGATLELFAAGLFLALFYRWPLRGLGLGEPAVFLVWGPLMLHGTFYVTTGGWSPEVALLAILYGLGPTVIVIAAHLETRAQDAARGLWTMPVWLGEARARVLARLLIALQYALLCTLFYRETFGWPVLPVLLCATTVPPLWATLSDSEQDASQGEVESAAARTAAHARLFSAALLVAVLVDVLLAHLLPG